MFFGNCLMIFLIVVMVLLEFRLGVGLLRIFIVGMLL